MWYMFLHLIVSTLDLQVTCYANSVKYSGIECVLTLT